MSENDLSSSKHPSLDGRPGSPAIYSLAVVVVPLFSTCLLLWIAGTGWFMQHDAYPELRDIGYGLTLVHEDCEVVLSGDSSAMTGLDPAVVQRITGMKTCNVAEGGTVTSVVGTYPLDAYLSQNKRPRYLVMMLTPGLFRPSPHRMIDPQPEGYTYLLQYVRGQQMFRALLSNPKATFRYAAWVSQRLEDEFWGRLMQTNPDDPAKDGGAERRRRHGIFTFPSPTETECWRTALHLDPASFSGDPAGVAEARTKYATGGTQLIINVAPVPTCDELQQTYERILTGEHDNAFERLPIAWFNSQDVHFNATGAQYLSEKLARQILDREGRSDGAKN